MDISEKVSYKVYKSNCVFLCDRLYVFGGKDMNSGMMDSVWYIDCRDMHEFIPGETEFGKNPNWIKAKTTGISKPKPICNHTCCVFPEKNKVYLYGGLTDGGQENMDMYSLELKKFLWQLVKPKPANGKLENLPGPRDEHSACVFEDNMIIFGGF